MQAKQAVALAALCRSRSGAQEDLTQAESLLKDAEDSWRAGRAEEQVDITARRAISTAVKAESNAALRKSAREKRNEKTRNDAEIRAAEDKFADAQTQINELKRELDAETRRRELSERDAQNYSAQVKDLKDENSRLRDQLTQARTEAETAKSQLTNVQGENQSIKAQQEREERLTRIKAGEAALLASLRRVGTVSKNERGIVVTDSRNVLVRDQDEHLCSERGCQANGPCRGGKRQSGLLGDDRVAYR